MHILTALTYYRPHYSGLTIYAEREARTLTARGHKVTILTSRYQDDLPAYEIIDGIEIIRPKVWFRLSKGVIMPSIPYWAWKLAGKADIVQLHVPQLDAAIISVISRLLGKPVVLTYHCDLQLPSGLVHKAANFASDVANHITAHMANVIVQNSKDYAQNSPFLKQYLDKIIPIPPPIVLSKISDNNVDAFQKKFNIKPGDRVIGMAARLATEKGVEFLAEALPIILKKFPTARVLFVGPDDNVVGEETYAQLIKELIKPLGKHWSFLGILTPEEMTAFFRVSEVTVLPSINSTESYGLVQIESMICNTPVVASDIPGVRVPVTSTGMGKIVPPADPEKLAAAIIEILENPQSYWHVSGDLLIQSQPEAVAEAYEKIFEDLLSDSKSRSH